MQVRASKRSLSSGKVSLGRAVMGFALAALCAAGCSDEDDGDGLPPVTTDGGSGGSGDTSPTAGSAGSAGETENGGSGGSSGSGSADAGPIDDGEGEPEPVSGETGLFIGATAAHNAV